MKFNIDNVRICSDDFQVGDCTVTAIYENNEIGRFVFRVCPNYEGEPVVAIPCLMYVAEPFRKKGVGTKIIRSVPIHVKFMSDVGASEFAILNYMEKQNEKWSPDTDCRSYLYHGLR